MRAYHTRGTELFLNQHIEGGLRNLSTATQREDAYHTQRSEHLVSTSYTTHQTYKMPLSESKCITISELLQTWTLLHIRCMETMWCHSLILILNPHVLLNHLKISVYHFVEKSEICVQGKFVQIFGENQGVKFSEDLSPSSISGRPWRNGEISSHPLNVWSDSTFEQEILSSCIIHERSHT